MIAEKSTFKKKLYEHCIALINGRITAVVQLMENAQAAANSEEKSSAGDKYETSRAMSHLEKDMQARQLAANKNELAALLAIGCNALQATVAAGSVVVFDDCLFFLAAGLGKISFEAHTVYLISPNAPVARSLMGKTAGDKITFNNRELSIGDVF